MNLFVMPLLFVACGDKSEDTGDTVEVASISDIEQSIACSPRENADNSGTLYIVSRNQDATAALVIEDPNGYPSGDGNWLAGQQPFSVELHLGTNVGVNYCTDDFEEEQIDQVFTPISINEIPNGFDPPEESLISYNIGIPDCEGCGPEVYFSLESVWFRSDSGDYARIEQLSNGVEILFYYAG